MKKKQHISFTILAWLGVIGLLAYQSYANRYEDIAIDQGEAQEILLKTWEPIYQFYQDVITDESKGLILPPQYIQTKEDFIDFFTTTLSQRYADSFFDALIEEKENGDLVVKRGAFFPTIYEEEAYILKAYIREGRNIQGQQLIIEEMGALERGNYSRKNHYKRTINGDWVYHYYTGSGWHYYVDQDASKGE